MILSIITTNYGQLRQPNRHLETNNVLVHKRRDIESPEIIVPSPSLGLYDWLISILYILVHKTRDPESPDLLLCVLGGEKNYC